MAFLDIVIEGTMGGKVSSVSIDSQTHQDLIRLAMPIASYPQIQKLHDFYKDSRFEPFEFDDLRKELIQLQLVTDRTGQYAAKKKSSVFGFLQDFEKLCEVAQNLNLPIHCYSD